MGDLVRVHTWATVGIRELCEVETVFTSTSTHSETSLDNDLANRLDLFWTLIGDMVFLTLMPLISICCLSSLIVDVKKCLEMWTQQVLIGGEMVLLLANY